MSVPGPDGRASRTAPAQVKDGFPDELAELNALAESVRGTLSGERARVEALMSAGREWPYDEWCRHYRDHPVTGVLARRLIREFQGADGTWRAAAPDHPHAAQEGCLRAAVTFRDETATGKPVAAWEVAGLPDRMAVRELIGLRVQEEVARHNARPGNRFDGLVRPADAEVELNGYRLREPRRIGAECQAEIAERAFLAGGFFVLTGDRQVEDLDEVVELTVEPDLVFVELVALVGGQRPS
ncbi:uncharacterized protein DUF4132 [Streptomyces puniciscabiei]|uniref:Uncharacterized protein DUF4132 n=1 Tax=Streptomyces puniciscabiei TaxID=164348 RepID=A0A542U8F5_9ACTN|nr:DUF4132 domain-containing protein [Streptomyces puniciscabiei]TQK95342.1 uncharacterized protein DUF4132 [Streptomyces puniciscabiei]